MGQLLIRNLDDRVIATLKARAKDRNTSLEQYLREMVTEAAQSSPEAVWDPIDRLREKIGPVRLDPVRLIREDRDSR